MTKEEFQDFMKDKTAELFNTSKSGQSEYALGKSAFDNFERLSAELGIPKETILMVYFSKHRDGIISYLNGQVSQREPVQGRIKDCIVYLMLLWAMVDDKNIMRNKGNVVKIEVKEARGS